METLRTGIGEQFMDTDRRPSLRSSTEGSRDVLEVLASSIAKTAARETEPEPPLRVSEATTELRRELLLWYLQLHFPFQVVEVKPLRLENEISGEAHCNSIDSFHWPLKLQTDGQSLRRKTAGY
jgi:hypothetical protein